MEAGRFNSLLNSFEGVSYACGRSAHMRSPWGLIYERDWRAVDGPPSTLQAPDEYAVRPSGRYRFLSVCLSRDIYFRLSARASLLLWLHLPLRVSARASLLLWLHFLFDRLPEHRRFFGFTFLIPLQSSARAAVADFRRCYGLSFPIGGPAPDHEIKFWGHHASFDCCLGAAVSRPRLSRSGDMGRLPFHLVPAPSLITT